MQIKLAFDCSYFIVYDQLSVPVFASHISSLQRYSTAENSWPKLVTKETHREFAHMSSAVSTPLMSLGVCEESIMVNA